MKRLLMIMLAAVALVAGCGSPAASGTPVNSEGAKQLEFTSTTFTGADFSGKSLLGKPAVLWFWAPWCPVCQREAPTVAKAASANPTVTFVGVAAQDQLPAMKEFATRFGLTFTQLADLDASVWRKFGVTQQPAYAFVDGDGSVDVVKSTLSEQDLTARISALTAG